MSTPRARDEAPMTSPARTGSVAVGDAAVPEREI